jgi:hypothetical protein
VRRLSAQLSRDRNAACHPDPALAGEGPLTGFLRHPVGVAFAQQPVRGRSPSMRLGMTVF